SCNKQIKNSPQLKLLIHELFFFDKLIKFSPYTDFKDYIVVYIGAGPGSHLIKLINCIWNNNIKLQFYLYDTRFSWHLKNYALKFKERVKLINKYFSLEDISTFNI